MRFCVLLLASPLFGEMGAADRQSMLRAMDAKADHYGKISRQIWEFAEVGYRETKSAALLRAELDSAGFRIQDKIAGIPTAFTATWGQGKPVIAIMGEYDALPELSQEDVPQRKARVNGAPGHGCGHNLFGTASAMAAIAVKNYMVEKKLPGTVRFYGTPAEEGGGGKIYMARAGVFNDVDAALVWHPSDSNASTIASSLANINAKFRFIGTAAHAAGRPEAGRSALDALLLMSHAVELLREHVPSSVRIHYIITKGGAAPNIVPNFAEGYFYARAPQMSVLDGVWDRIIKCAQAGALATETKMEMELVNSVYNILPNEPLQKLSHRHMTAIGGIRYTPEENAFAQEIRKTVESERPLGSQEKVVPFGSTEDLGGSTDVGDISWQVPTMHFTAATFVPGVSAHSWQSTACAGMSIGRKGMMVAAKTLALSAIDLLTTPDLVKSARDDYEKRKGGRVYKSRVPADGKPPLNYRGE